MAFYKTTLVQVGASNYLDTDCMCTVIWHQHFKDHAFLYGRCSNGGLLCIDIAVYFILQAADRMVSCVFNLIKFLLLKHGAK